MIHANWTTSGRSNQVTICIIDYSHYIYAHAIGEPKNGGGEGGTCRLNLLNFHSLPSLLLLTLAIALRNGQRKLSLFISTMIDVTTMKWPTRLKRQACRITNQTHNTLRKKFRQPEITFAKHARHTGLPRTTRKENCQVKIRIILTTSKLTFYVRLATFQQ